MTGRITETITWLDPAKQMPDDDETVLLLMPEASEPVWPGYHDGDDGWLLAEGGPAPRVHRWARMPGGRMA